MQHAFSDTGTRAIGSAQITAGSAQITAFCTGQRRSYVFVRVLTKNEDANKFVLSVLKLPFIILLFF